MSKHSKNDKPPIDQHVQDLLNGNIDGELNATEQAELDQLMASSKHVRDLNEELTAVSRFFDQAPEREPPDYLQSTIEKQIRLPVVSNGSDGKVGIFGSWLSANWLRTGFALAAGVILTVGVYEMGSEPITDQDSANMVGTVVKNPVSKQGELLGTILVETDLLNGVVELRNADNLFILDLQLNSAGLSEVAVNFAGQGLVFEDITRERDHEDTITVADGSVTVATSGEQHYTMRLRPTSEFVEDRPLELEFFANNKLVHEAKLSVSQE
ncbi:MAG: hypothetical protein GY732_02620 [Gammaproteobacteria bacterium]|nr:hypothetical protein [Gammaproteobacteria bacterium]